MNYSIITACLNSSVTVLRSINSVFSQQILPKEYIFVDGGSEDDTLKIIDTSISSAINRKLDIKFDILHQQTKGGIYEAWNMAIRKVSGEVIFILNSDDWYMPDTAAYVMSCFKENLLVEIVLGAGRYYNDISLNESEICNVRPSFILPFAMTIVHPACFVKKSVYDRLGLFDDRYKVAGDYDFIYRCIKSRVKLKQTKKILVNIQCGGFAEKHKLLARKELVEIGKRHCFCNILPQVAYFTRAMLSR